MTKTFYQWAFRQVFDAMKMAKSCKEGTAETD